MLNENPSTQTNYFVLRGEKSVKVNATYWHLNKSEADLGISYRRLPAWDAVTNGCCDM